MPDNFQVYDAYGSIINIQSSIFGSAHRQIVGVSVIGTINTSPSGNQSVSGTVGSSVIGTVPITQSGTIITSIISIVPSSVIVGTSIFGQLPAGTAPLGSVAALQGTNPWNMAGSVASHQAGTWITSIINTIPSSVIVGASIFGQLPAGTAPLGSVAVLQGTNPWANTNVGSIITIQVGSVITTQVGSIITTFSQSPSITGTYAEDAGHTAGDKGIFVLGVRNDAITSIAGTDRDYAPIAVDESSRVITVPFAGTKACIISYTGSVVSASVTLIQPSAVGSRSYITDFWIANTGSADQLITFQGGDTSVLGYTMAPSGGGSNSPGIAIPWRTTLSQDLAFKATGTSSVVYVTVSGYQAP